MATPTMNVSLTPELKAFIERRVRSGLYGNGSDVVRAGLRALVREETAQHYKRFQQILASLPQDPITPTIEQDIERRIKRARRAAFAAKRK
ncbi:MAG TPA: type II toxin-antitoxin system ParD family antitoxin [Verrucomicrobiae bacterium]|nr:type II toxin-antitoxin system ParD family antitoxin [Verrucomicrobiae bacterium]